MNNVLEFLDGFNELVQIFLGFAIGLAFSQANLAVGWILFWIVVWETGVFIIASRTKHYNPFFRIAYNCVFLIAILIGQYVYFGKTTFQNFLYPESIQTKQAYWGKKYKFMEIVEGKLDEFVNGEEDEIKRKKIKNRSIYFRK